MAFCAAACRIQLRRAPKVAPPTHLLRRTSVVGVVKECSRLG